MEWFKRNWLLFILIVLALVFVVGWVDNCKDNEEYKRKIEESDRRLEDLDKKIVDSNLRADEALKKAKNWECKAMSKENELSKVVIANERLKEEREKLKEKIAKMPPDEIVERTQEIIKSNEVENLKIGIVFSLAASKKNLGILEGFSLCQQEKNNLEKAVDICKEEVDYLKEALGQKDIALLAKDDALINWELKEVEWKNKFDLCEKQRGKSWRKGFLFGSVVGGGLILILALFSGI